MSKREEKKKKVVEVLNKARAMELQAIIQYMNHHYKLDDLDFGDMAKNMKLIAIDEMRHAEAFAERVSELGGEPVAEPIAPITKGHGVNEIFDFDAGEEENAIEAYNSFLQVCRENGDSVSAKMLEQIIEDEQEHLNYFEAISGHIESMGDTYLARIAGTSASTGLAPQGFVIAKGGGE